MTFWAILNWEESWKREVMCTHFFFLLKISLFIAVINRMNYVMLIKMKWFIFLMETIVHNTNAKHTNQNQE